MKKVPSKTKRIFFLIGFMLAVLLMLLPNAFKHQVSVCGIVSTDPAPLIKLSYVRGGHDDLIIGLNEYPSNLFSIDVGYGYFEPREKITGVVRISKKYTALQPGDQYILIKVKKTNACP